MSAEMRKNQITARRLVWVGEECNELGQAAMKVLRFGPELRSDQTGKSGLEMLTEEAGHVLAVIELLHLDPAALEVAKDHKLQRLATYDPDGDKPLAMI